MAIMVKDTAKAVAKFVRNAANAAGDYKDGVAASGNAWEAGAKAGADNFAVGVGEAIADKRFERGVSGKAGKFVTNATKLGATRYPDGIRNAEQAYQGGVGPYLDRLKSLTLPPKGPRGSQANQGRANMVALELRKMKVGR